MGLIGISRVSGAFQEARESFRQVPGVSGAFQRVSGDLGSFRGFVGRFKGSHGHIRRSKRVLVCTKQTLRHFRGL